MMLSSPPALEALCPSGLVTVTDRNPVAMLLPTVMFNVMCVASVKVMLLMVIPLPLNAAAMRLAKPAPGSKNPDPPDDVPVSTMLVVTPAATVEGLTLLGVAGGGASSLATCTS